MKLHISRIPEEQTAEGYRRYMYCGRTIPRDADYIPREYPPPQKPDNVCLTCWRAFHSDEDV